MTTLTAVDGYQPHRSAPAPSTEGRVWVVVSVLALVVSTLLVAGYLEYLGAATLLRNGQGQAFTGLWEWAFIRGVLRSGSLAFGAGLVPVMVVVSLPGARIRSVRGPLALLGAGVATMLCLMGILVALT